ncbi:MAG: CoA-binding protein [Deltaproteobacteria bacterium]|nr:CoA-binding protein [Deltaproteobacteria bacterium]
MDFFFYPDGITVIGATDNPLKGGFHILNNILIGYKGRVYPVNPKYDSISGLKCYPDIKSIPGTFDLAIYFIPARFLPDTIEQCAQKKVKGIIIESAGFAEVGQEGRKLQEECLALAKKYNIRLWGPNCMGLMDSHSRHVFSFMYGDYWKDLMEPGDVSLIVQSGLLSAGFLMMILQRGGMGISKVCSIGNKCDVNEIDLLEYLINDPSTDVIGLYVESIVDGRKFIDLARSTHKPIVILKGGRSAYGAKAAISHTASMAGDYAIISSAFKQAGVTTVFDANELTDFLKGFSKIHASRNDGGTAIITFSGSGGIITADFLNDFGLSLAELSENTINAIKEVFPSWMDPSNPVDIWPAIEQNGFEKVYSKAIDALLHDQNVDSLIVHIFNYRLEKSYLSELASLKDELGKPVVIWLVGIGKGLGVFRRELEDSGLPVFTEIGRCVSVLAAIKTHYAKRGSRPLEEATKSPYGKKYCCLD